MSEIKVMIVDDSAVVRQALSSLLAGEPGIEVVGTAADPLFAMEKMQRQWPDVIVLDMEMPRMNGLTFLRCLMAERPTPVVICSALGGDAAGLGMQALAAGAVSVIAKPTLASREASAESADSVVNAIKGAARADLRSVARRRGPARAFPPRVPATATAAAADLIVGLGASTGGTQALESVLTRLPESCPAIVIVQHMPEKYTEAFAQRLDKLCRIEVREARDGEQVAPGVALIAPGGRHMRVKRGGGCYQIEIAEGPPVNRHRPAVDVLFRSLASCAGRNALGILMTGMGDDGARGLKEMRDAGARTAAQDEASCVVYGMPREAVRLGAAERVLSLDGIPAAILGAADGSDRPRAPTGGKP